MAWIKQFLLLWSIFHESLASKVDSCSKPNFTIENVDMSEIMETQFEVGRKLRLKCQRGYKRMAGTSNLIKCQYISEFAKWTKPILQCITMTSLATSVKPTALTTSVEPTSVEPAKSGTTADHYTSTMDITVASGSHLSAALTTVTRAATLTTATRSISISSQTSSSTPLTTDISDKGLRPLNMTWRAVKPSASSGSTAGTESTAAVPSDRKQRATAGTESTAAVSSDRKQRATVGTTITFISSNTSGMETITTRKTLAGRTVISPTPTETTSDFASTVTTTGINQTVTAGKNIGLVIGTSTGSLFVIFLVILFFVWPLVCKNRISCTRFWAAEYELTPVAPMDVPTVVNANETNPLQSPGES
ncbi:interleukin-15 receptor subunit alpha-like isoform X4 [Mobula hypostoma]|uniref:interleukin-15 receptor subunit alpha-like isoform X4 n=1 Tax=Mobula hypostoma TaxID=723540 RepID=UPI002FC3AEC0